MLGYVDGSEKTQKAECRMQKSELERMLPQNQRHLLRFWSDLSDPQRQRLADQIASIDFALVERLVQGAAKQDNWAALAQRAQPPEAFRLDGKGNKFTLAQARAAGDAALKRGEIGAILVAGGQGTRMGFDKPKGMYKIGPVSGASLFQILLERLVAVGRRYGVAVPLYVMTSDATHADTEDYFQKHNRFGLAEENVRLFCQGTMPAVDIATLGVLLADKGEVALSPDGHGGMLAAMVTSGALDDIKRRGIKTLFYFQVDNPLAEVCDPAFLGYHILAHSEMSTLAVAKREPLERVGNVVQIDGRTRIIEYSDLPDEVAKRLGSDGKPQLWAGNTAIHVLDVAFLQRVQGKEETLPFHTARKKWRTSMSKESPSSRPSRTPSNSSDSFSTCSRPPAVRLWWKRTRRNRSPQ